MIDLHFAYRGASLLVVAPNERDDIPTRIRTYGTFYEFDVLERCEHYVRKLPGAPGLIIDVGAYIGNHTLFFATFCGAAEVIAFEASRDSYQVLLQTIERNGLKNVRACNVAVGDSNEWGRIAVRDPENLGANRVQPADAGASDAVRVVPLDAHLRSIGADAGRITLIKIDVEGMECAVIRGASASLSRWRPVLCVEILDAEHMDNITPLLNAHRYLIREVNGAAPTYIATPQERMPRFLIRALNFGWSLLARFGNNTWRWRYRRVIEIVFPFQP